MPRVILLAHFFTFSCRLHSPLAFPFNLQHHYSGQRSSATMSSKQPSSGFVTLGRKQLYSLTAKCRWW